jgi:ABC-type nitrate/sulfonate/bicarbonate transport system substrate-binding protein
MKKINVAGVPEHFNHPWHIALDKGLFARAGIDLTWTDVPEGTGKMCQMLRNGDTDIAVILTEGIVKDIVQGNPSKIVQEYVASPLVWGIHVAAGSSFRTMKDIAHATAAISREGSGSQLMAYVNAANQGWITDNLKFKIVHTIDGAVEALSAGHADYFMWERFMTKPLVDKGIFRRIADCPTPWPCFVIAVRDEVLASDRDTVSKMLSVINSVTATFKEIPGVDAILADRFHQKKEDIQTWLGMTKWSQSGLAEDMLNKVQNQLLELSLIDKKGTFAEMVKTL